MANGRQRDEWSRFSELLSLIHNRVTFSNKIEPTRPLDWYPAGIITPEELRDIADAIKREKESRIVRVPFSVIMEAAGVKPHGRK